MFSQKPPTEDELEAEQRQALAAVYQNLIGTWLAPSVNVVVSGLAFELLSNRWIASFSKQRKFFLEHILNQNCRYDFSSIVGDWSEDRSLGRDPLEKGSSIHAWNWDSKWLENWTTHFQNFLENWFQFPVSTSGPVKKITKKILFFYSTLSSTANLVYSTVAECVKDKTKIMDSFGCHYLVM